MSFPLNFLVIITLINDTGQGQLGNDINCITLKRSLKRFLDLIFEKAESLNSKQEAQKRDKKSGDFYSRQKNHMYLSTGNIYVDKPQWVYVLIRLFHPQINPVSS